MTLDQVLLFALLGLGTGALIAGIALGVVLFYRGAGVINLATGAIAMLAGYAFWSLRTGTFGGDVPTAPALVITLLVVLGLGVAMELFAFRPLQAASPLAKLASTLGVLLTLQAAMLLSFGTASKPQPPVLPSNLVKLFGVNVPVDRFILAGIVVAAAVVLAAVYRWTRFGLATRAASENEVSAMLAGLSPNGLSMANTLLACLVAGGLGVLAASITQLNSQTLPLQIVPALAAALLARFTSFAIACAAGLLIGVAENVLYYLQTQSWFPTDHGIALPGVQQLFVFVVIVIAMFWRGASLPGRGELIEKRLPVVPRPERLGRNAAIATLVCAGALIVLPWDFRQALIVSLLGALICLSLVVITGFVGQISVVQLALAGVAGFTVSHMAVDHGIGFPLGPLIGVAVALLLGLLTAVSALRVRGVSLAVVTLAAAVAIEQFGFVNSTWGGGSAASPVPSPTLFGFDFGSDASFRGLDGKLPSPIFGLITLAAMAALCLLVGNVRRSSFGQRMLAVRSNERAAAAAGINVTSVKLTAFGLAALVAGVAGVLYSYNFGSVSAARFGALAALGLIAFAYVGGITMVSGAVLAGLISTQGLVPYALDKWLGVSGNWALLFGGLALIVTLIANPEGVAGAEYRKKQERRRRRAAGEPRPRLLRGRAALLGPSAHGGGQPGDSSAGSKTHSTL
jgi:branched-subunit amino acid ABC-type transport system permease component